MSKLIKSDALRNNTIREWFRESKLLFIRWSSYMLLIWCFHVTSIEPDASAVRGVLDFVKNFGLLVVIVVPLIKCIFNTSIWDTWIDVYTESVLRGLLILSLATWLIGGFGDQIYKWAIENPNDASVTMVGLAIIWAITSISSGYSTGINETVLLDSVVSRSAIAINIPELQPTEADIQYIAAHEVGHLLPYAALGSLPDHMQIVINDYSDNGALGYVTGIESKNLLDNKTLAEWGMLVALGGKQGEDFVYGETTLGSSGDHDRWLSLARRYLANHNRGMFYTDPKNRLELEQNERKLEALQAEQGTMLTAFFELNAGLFKELINVLLEKRSMTRDDMAPFLSRVNLPAGFPRPVSMD